MMEYLKDLTQLTAPSGSEQSVRDYIINNLPKNTEYTVDALGNLIVNVKGKKRPESKVLLDAHTDEVGFIVTFVESNGLLRFATLGGIEKTAMLAKKVVFLNGVTGVICVKPVHLQSDDELNTLPENDELFIDIGAADETETKKYVNIGDTAAFFGEFKMLDENRFLSKAIDDRAGCAVLLKIINTYDEYDYTVSFSSQEEVGLRGARASAYTVNPDFAIVCEATTAADIPNISGSDTVCRLGDGVAVSYMDSATLYNRELFKMCLEIGEENNIPVQPKMLPTGGNNAGAIHLSRSGVKTVSLSLPCRYIHSSSCVADFRDIAALEKIIIRLLDRIAGNGK